MRSQAIHVAFSLLGHADAQRRRSRVDAATFPNDRHLLGSARLISIRNARNPVNKALIAIRYVSFPFDRSRSSAERQDEAQLERSTLQDADVKQTRLNCCVETKGKLFTLAGPAQAE